MTVVVPRRPISSAAAPSHDGHAAVISAAPASADHPPTGGKIRVLLADDQPILLEGLVRLLHEQPDMEVVGTAVEGRTALEVAFQTRPDVAVLDVSMPDVSGVEVTRRLAAALPGTRVIGLSIREEEDVALAMRTAGAAAYLSKSGSPEALIAAIRGQPRSLAKDYCHDS